MAGLSVTEAQEMWPHQVQSFAQKELAPGAKERAKFKAAPRETIKNWQLKTAAASSNLSLDEA